MVEVSSKRDTSSTNPNPSAYFYFRFQIRENAKIASLKVKAKQENVSGVQLPSFDMITDGGSGK